MTSEYLLQAFYYYKNQLLPFGHFLDSKCVFLIPESMLGPATVIAGPMKALLDSRVHSCEVIV